jgi:hypothetical protein
VFFIEIADCSGGSGILLSLTHHSVVQKSQKEEEEKSWQKEATGRRCEKQ